MDKQPVVELAIGKVKSGVSRQLLLDPQDLWIDIVHWRSMDAVLAATDSLMKLESAQPITAMLDPATIRMYHLELVYLDVIEASIPESLSAGTNFWLIL